MSFRPNENPAGARLLGKPIDVVKGENLRGSAEKTHGRIRGSSRDLPARLPPAARIQYSLEHHDAGSKATRVREPEMGPTPECPGDIRDLAGGHEITQRRRRTARGDPF